MSSLRYRRVVVKLSGRAFAGDADFGLDNQALGYVADQLISARDLGIEEAVVVGGGNFFRGNVADQWEIERAEADNIGMLGTVMNGILLRGVLKHRGLEDVRLITALPMTSMAEPYIRLKALAHLEALQMVLLAAGIGQPYVTTTIPPSSARSSCTRRRSCSPSTAPTASTTATRARAQAPCATTASPTPMCSPATCG